MEKSAINYLVEAFFILWSNIFYVFIIVILSSGFYFSKLIIEDLRTIFYFLIAVSLLAALPLIYGQFVEIICYERKDSWVNILNKYWLRFIAISLILKGPILILRLFLYKMALEQIANLIIMQIADGMLVFTIPIVSIYIFPLVFINKEVFSSIQLGFKCLLGNIKFSLPLVIITAFSVLFSLLMEGILNYINSFILSSLFLIVLVSISIIIDFTLFIGVCLILKDKLLAT